MSITDTILVVTNYRVGDASVLENQFVKGIIQ